MKNFNVILLIYLIKYVTKMGKFGTGCHKYNLGNRQIARSNLNLLQHIFKKKKGTIKNDLSKEMIKAHDYEDLAEYLIYKFNYKNGKKK